MLRAIIASVEELPEDPQWLGSRPCPVIAYGVGAESASADVLVPDLAAARAIEKRVEAWPIAAMTLVQVLRSTALLPAAQALDVESMAFSTLQGGEEFAAWTRSGKRGPPLPAQAGDPVLLSRDGAVIEAILNRAGTRNAISVEMRDAWVEALQLLEADESVEELRFRALGACFSAGGELHEFGLAPDPATAHWVRTVHSPARLLAKLGARVSFFVHGACIGSGIELPAFASRVVAHPNTFFQLPELQMGLIPGAGGTVSISRRIGRQRTAWMVLTGRRINARTALEWGLVDELAEWS
jgi:hypothetical protein